MQNQKPSPRTDSSIETTPLPVFGSRRSAVRALLVVCLATLAATATATDPKEIRLGSDEWPPFTGSHGTERAALELIHTALDRAGYQATTVIEEWKQVEAAIRRGDLDGSAAMWRTKAREKTLVFSAPYLENRLVLIGRTGSDVSAARMTDLAGKRVAAVGQYAYGDDVSNANGVIFVNSKSDQDSLDKLLAGVVDYMLVDELVVRRITPDDIGGA